MLGKDEIIEKIKAYNESSNREWSNDKVRAREGEVEIENPECVICKERKNLQLHHIEPKSEGGTDRAENLVHVCEDCHDIIHGRPAGALAENGSLKEKYADDDLIQFIKTVYGYDDLLRASRRSPALERLKEAVKEQDKERGIVPDWETGERCPDGVFPSAKIYSGGCEKSVIGSCDRDDCPYYSKAESIFELRNYTGDSYG